MYIAGGNIHILGFRTCSAKIDVDPFWIFGISHDLQYVQLKFLMLLEIGSWISGSLNTWSQAATSSQPRDPCSQHNLEPQNQWVSEARNHKGFANHCKSLKQPTTKKPPSPVTHKESPSATIDFVSFSITRHLIRKATIDDFTQQIFEMTSPPSNHRAITAMEEECRPSIGKLWRVEKLRHSRCSCWLLREIIGFSWISAIFFTSGK